jgi:FkbM family methyltransferase
MRTLLEGVRHRGIPNEVETFRVVDNPGVTFVRADSFVTERLYWFGERYGYEPGGIHWWRQFCRESERVLELGANIGYYTVQGGRAAPNAHYTAVEPHPGCVATCRRNVQVNGLSNVDVIEAAAVAHTESGRVTLRLPGGKDHYTEAPSTGFVGRNEVHHADADDPSYGEVVVPAVELRSLMAGVDLLKLDVEGQEFDLLSSITDELGSRRPTIFLELLDDTPALRALVADLCTSVGYRCFVPTLGGLVPLSVDGVSSLDVRSRSDTRDIVMTCRET